MLKGVFDITIPDKCNLSPGVAVLHILSMRVADTSPILVGFNIVGNKLLQYINETNSEQYLLVLHFNKSKLKSP